MQIPNNFDIIQKALILLEKTLVITKLFPRFLLCCLCFFFKYYGSTILLPFKLAVSTVLIMMLILTISKSIEIGFVLRKSQ